MTTTAFFITVAAAMAVYSTGPLAGYLSPTLGQSEMAKEIAREIVSAKENVMMWSTMPLAGALLASAMAFALNRRSEQLKLVFGRAIGAIVMGVVGPRIGTYAHPWIKELSLDPIVVCGAGFAFGLAGYALAAAVVDKFFKKAPAIAENAINDVAERARFGKGEG
ncbi:hypothetical protein [Verrucomicrobium sp. BvORR034]|uniref:hypothetical protein n=1 Tax=Verrucomicrobium sp. BvORR034 TaxID=1396418 RepID=UPI000678868C|nr:hypothetical protein [Verrucomicrobium sp. BvORR034]